MVTCLSRRLWVQALCLLYSFCTVSGDKKISLCVCVCVSRFTPLTVIQLERGYTQLSQDNLQLPGSTQIVAQA